MKRITTISIALVVWLTTSCLNENEPQPESKFKPDVLSYLEQFKESINDEGDQKINELINALNFRKANQYAHKGKEELLVVDINSLNGFEKSEKLFAIFFLNQGTIVRSSILALSNPNNTDELITSFFNSVIPKNYSGKISLYNILQNIEFFSVLENGELRANGNINGSKNIDENGKINGCIDWYLITTYYYADGSRKTTDYFLFRTCDCEEQNSRMGRVNCGEGGTGGATPGSGGPVFPANPQNGDEYEYRYPDGRKVFYKYNTYTSSWDWLFWLLPEATVQSHPLTYPYLLTDGPTDDENKLGPDKFVFKFDGGTGNWVGTPIGNRPLLEYSNKCQGLQDIWNNYPSNEVAGYITQDGKLLVIDVVSNTGGATSGTYYYNGITYYPYPVSQGAPTETYTGMIQSAGYYLIPVVASVHTHAPCRTDGTNGVSQSVGSDDLNVATKSPNIQHWVIGCGAIAQFNASGTSFFNVQSGLLSALCSNIQ